MKILQVNKLYAPVVGGVETVVRDIAEGLNETADMRVLVCQNKGKATEELYNNVRVVRASSFGTFLSLPLSFDFFRRYRYMSRDADVIQLHAPFPLGDLAVLFFRRKAGLVVWWHSDIIRQRLFLILLRPVINHMLRKADLIVVASDAIVKSSAFLLRHVDKCKVIPFGLDFKLYPEVPASMGILAGKLNDQGCKILRFVGRLVYYKGVDVLVRAMKNVDDAELFIVGIGPLEDELKDSVQRFGLESKIHFLGALDRDMLLGAFYDCDVFVFPSVAKSEAFGLCQLEAMFYGKPVINTNLPTAVPTVSVDGETGITVPVGDDVALGAAIMKLMVDDVLRETYGVNAAQRVRERFDKTRMIEELHNSYAALLDKSPIVSEKFEVHR